MADPIVEKISQNIKTTLESVTVANGFNIDLSVERINKRLGTSPEDNKVVIIQGTPSRDFENESQGQMWWLQPYELWYTIVESEKSSTPIDQRLNIGRADIEKKLLEDHTRGDFAIDTRINDPDYLVDINGMVTGVVVNITVQFAHDFTDPFSQ